MVRLSHNQTMILLIVTTVVISILPILLMAPTWLIIACIFCLFYRVIQAIFNSPPTHLLIRLTLTIVGFFLLVIEVKGRLDYLFFIYFLALFISFKVLEIKDKRDYLTQVLVNLYVLFASLIVVMELWIFAYIMIAGLLNFVVLFKINNPSIRLSIFNHSSLPLLTLTLVITAILFYVFPRISTPLWQLPSPGQKQTGFSDKLQLGDIHQLVLDDSQAMKVVSHSSLGLNPYWRGLALTFYDGRSWQISKAARTPDEAIPKLPYSQPADIEIILEPTRTPWLITTAQVERAYPNLLHIPNVGITLLSKHRITRQIGYRFNINKNPSRIMNSSIWHLNTQFPSYANPRLQKWAKDVMRTSRQQPNLIIEHIKSEIMKKPFWYTLTPAPIGKNARQLDKFWFDTREGYCEYYASSVAFILRAAGIPARIIVGYQGGNWNPFGQYLLIKQSDAHAWVEYWDDNKGWLRLDPTAWIPSNRIDDSIQNRVQRLRQTGIGLDFNGYGKDLGFWQSARYYLESAHFFWQRWLLFYNYDTQQQLLDIISSQTVFTWLYKNLIWIWMVIVFFIILISVLWWKNRPDPLQRELLRLKLLCDKLNINHYPPETFATLCEQLINRFPSESKHIQLIQQNYDRLRLQKTHTASHNTLIKFFKTFVKELNYWKKLHKN